jgi:hypothetical protein
MRLKRFYKRFKNQYHIHHLNFSIWMIARIAWKQSRKSNINTILDKYEIAFKKLSEL